LSLYLSVIELSVTNEGFVNVAQEIISIVLKTRYSKYGSYGRYDLAAYTAEITSRAEKINCVRATNERTKRLPGGFPRELRLGAGNSEQQDIKVQNSIKSTFYV